jgi:hypothetical protein
MSGEFVPLAQPLRQAGLESAGANPAVHWPAKRAGGGSLKWRSSINGATIAPYPQADRNEGQALVVQELPPA